MAAIVNNFNKNTLLWKPAYRVMLNGVLREEPPRYKIQNFGKPDNGPIFLNTAGKLVAGGVVIHNNFRRNV